MKKKRQLSLVLETMQRLNKQKYPVLSKSGYKKDLTKGMIAENGGVILLWSYLDILFSQFRILSGNRFKGVEEQTAAVYMLHYLATGSVLAEEHELLVPKIITAYDLDEPVPVNFNLGTNVRTECDHLILYVIKHWVALKSTSPDGLRRTFLQRCALIKLGEDGWHFMFERKGVDVLIDRLPYALSVIKLKWLDNPIYVSW